MAATFKKHELEAQLKDENDLIRHGILRDENPLDASDDFHSFLEACRRGDLKRCQELISSGVNINGKDSFDYTPLIVVSGGADTSLSLVAKCMPSKLSHHYLITDSLTLLFRPVCVATLNWFSCY